MTDITSFSDIGCSPTPHPDVAALRHGARLGAANTIAARGGRTVSRTPPHAPPTEPLTFLGLADSVLRAAPRPLTVTEIWSLAASQGLDRRLRSQGKTPAASLGALLYMEVQRDGSRFRKVGDRPARFALLTTPDVAPPEEAPPRTEPPRSSTAPEPSFVERDMHPVLAHFAERTFRARCLTVFHERSQRAPQKKNEWLHPDMVGFTLITQAWNPAAYRISSHLGARGVRLYSFELKREIDFSTLRESFFQAVSNSSWAHEGYLAVWKIEPDPEFREELQRLSESFGIGVISLRPDSPGESGVLHPARPREVDWSTVNRIANANDGFQKFLEAVDHSLKINRQFTEGFDPTPTEDQLLQIARRVR